MIWLKCSFIKSEEQMKSSLSPEIFQRSKSPANSFSPSTFKNITCSQSVSNDCRTNLHLNEKVGRKIDAFWYLNRLKQMVRQFVENNGGMVMDSWRGGRLILKLPFLYRYIIYRYPMFEDLKIMMAGRVPEGQLFNKILDRNMNG